MDSGPLRDPEARRIEARALDGYREAVSWGWEASARDWARLVVKIRRLARAKERREPMAWRPN